MVEKMKILVVEKINGGVKIKDDVSRQAVKYYGYTVSEAIKEHRAKFNLKYKHFEKIYI